MKTFHFFRFERHVTPPRINTFSITFDESSGGPIYTPNETPQGIYILDKEGGILERSDEAEISVPVILSLDDKRLMTFNQSEMNCIASTNADIIEMAVYFFRQGLMTGLSTLAEVIGEIRSLNSVPNSQQLKEQP